MFTDVPVTLDQMPTVPIKIDFLTQLGSKIELGKATANMGYALAKAVLDNMLSKVTTTNFTHAIPAVDAANFNLDELEAIRTKLNQNGANQRSRWGIINSVASQYLGTDSRIASSDFYNQTSGGASGFRQWTGVAGFDKISDFVAADDTIVLAATTTATTATAGVATAAPVAGASVQISAGGKVAFAAADDTFAEMVQALVADDNNLADGEVAFFEFGGNTYVYAANDTDQDTDALIELTGVVGLTTLTVTSGAITFA
jgi:hypothetical protein